MIRDFYSEARSLSIDFSVIASKKRARLIFRLRSSGRLDFQVLMSRLCASCRGLSREHIMFGMLDWLDCPEVERSKDKVSGAWVFRGTRVPVRSLFENLESGATIDQFLEWFPGVAREQVVTVLEHAEQSLVNV